MRHVLIGDLKLVKGKWEFSFFNGKLKKSFSIESTALEEAKKELNKFVRFCLEGAAFRIFKKRKITIYQSDVTLSGELIEYELSFPEFYVTHADYIHDKSDLEYLKKHKNDPKLSREPKEENDYQREIREVKAIHQKYSKEDVLKVTSKIAAEMQDYIDKYVKTLS